MDGLNLLEKTELWIHEITLEQVNLTQLASVVAKSLGLPEDKVMVVDVRASHITFDILEKNIPSENILGKEKEILENISQVDGVKLTADAYIHSNGILGLICADSENPELFLQRVESMKTEIVDKVLHRAIVFPTGFEIQQGLIEDTNTPYVMKKLEVAGYAVVKGGVIPDNQSSMVEILNETISRGFGLVITTGGVGAEDKDCSVESVLTVDPEAAVAYIVKYEKGHGRHVKDGVRIAVGQVGLTTFVTLPGPHDEVEITVPLLLQLLSSGSGKTNIAQSLAGTLAKKWITENKKWNCT